MIYDGFPTEPKRRNKRVEVSIDRVGPDTLYIEETRRIPPSVGEGLLGQPLNTVLMRARNGALPAAITSDVYARVLRPEDDANLD